MSGPMTMQQAADAYGWNYHHFKRHWRDLVRTKGFPGPFRERPNVWRREDVEAWLQRRAAAITAEISGGQVADLNQARPKAEPAAKVQRGRLRTLERMRGRA